MDQEERDYPAYIPDDWATAAARAYHHGAAAASEQPQAPYADNADVWQSWTDAHQEAADFTGVQADHDFNAPATWQRTIEHDKPPVWDGDKPEKQARPYVKTLDLWLSTTKVPPKTIGLLLLTYSKGDIKALIDEYEIEELKVEGVGEEILKKIKNVYNEYLEIKLPTTIEECLYDKDVVRRKGETLTMYVTRRDALWRKLKKTGGIEFPDTAKGYITLRDAHINERAWDTLTTWTQNAYDYNTIITHLRKLERQYLESLRP